MSSDKEYRTSEGLGYDMRMKPKVIVKFKLVVKLPAASVVSYFTIVIKEVNSSCSEKIQQSLL